VSGLLLPLLAAAATPPGQGLAAFERLIGRCWEGEIAPGALNVHCFDAVYGGAHVRDRHQVLVAGKVVYEGETLYSRDGAGLAFTYWNVLGGVGHGTGVEDSEGVCFAGTMRGRPDDAPQPIATCWRWQPDGGYVTRSGTEAPVHFRLSARRF